MSRTDKDRPFWVRVNDQLDIGHVEHHDHHNGECDLLVNVSEYEYYHRAGRCYLRTYRWNFGCPEGKSCGYCHPESKNANIRRRKTAVKMRGLLKEYRNGVTNEQEAC
jgi:hypothetical protein